MSTFLHSFSINVSVISDESDPDNVHPNDVVEKLEAAIAQLKSGDARLSDVVECYGTHEMETTWGAGNTPQKAMKAYAAAISNQTLIVDAYRPTRRSFNVLKVTL